MKVRALKKKLQLTPEEERIRKGGLRILARMIVRAHMEAKAIDCGELCGEYAAEDPATDLPGKDGEHVS